MKTALILSVNFLILTSLVGQKDKSVKYGKLNPSEFNTTICPIDSDAHAYYIFDHGESTFFVTPEKIQLQFQRHFRIKIIDKSAFDLGTFVIPLYHDGSKLEEELKDLKGVTYNLENGQMVESKLEKTSIFKEKTSDNWDRIKVSMPNIKEGTILEISYEIQSDFLFNFQGWTFQYDIPNLESTYLTVIPDAFKYNPHFTGYVNVDFSTQDRQRPTSDFIEKITIYKALNVPAFPAEPFVNNKDDYRSRIEFELASIRTASATKEYSATWNSLNTLLLDDESFGRQLNKTNYFKEQIAEVLAKNIVDPMLKVEAAFNFVKSHIKWNRKNGIYTTNNIRKSYESHIGNVADINLALVAILRELDLKAYPVILSTVDNGFVRQTFPTLSKMNYVVAAVFLEGKKILLDAADPYSSATLLPSKCLNGAGRVIDEQIGQWIDLTPSKMGQQQTTYTIKVDPEAGLTGKFQRKYYNYSGYDIRTQIVDSSAISTYIEKFKNKSADANLRNIKIDQFNNTELELILDAEIESSEGFEKTDELIYFTPIVLERIKENPFKIESRLFPIEFAYPWMESTTIELNVPVEYTVESLPKPMVLQNKNKTARFAYTTELINPQTVKINCLIMASKIKYFSEEYIDFKQFFDHISSKQAEQIVLRKKA